MFINLFLSIYAMLQRTREDNLTVWYRKKQTDVSFAFCPVIDYEFCHNILKLVCESTRLSPHCYDEIHDQ